MVFADTIEDGKEVYKTIFKQQNTLVILPNLGTKVIEDTIAIAMIRIIVRWLIDTYDIQSY